MVNAMTEKELTNDEKSHLFDLMTENSEIDWKMKDMKRAETYARRFGESVHDLNEIMGIMQKYGSVLDFPAGESNSRILECFLEQMVDRGIRFNEMHECSKL
jgi:hypothetical protein